MRIVHVAVDHGWLDVRVFYKQCRTLASAGHDVHVVTSEPSEESRDGVRFHSVGKRLVPPRVPVALRRAWLIAAQGRRFRSIYRLCRELKADVYHLHEPGLILVGRLLKQSGARVVYDAHEEYRQIAFRTQRRRPVWGRGLALWYALLERVAEKHFDSIVAATPAIARQYRRATVIHNYPLTSELFDVDRTPHPGRIPGVIFTGGISRIRGAVEVVRAMQLIPSELGCELHLIGKFMDLELETHLRREPGWSRVLFHGWKPRDEMVQQLRSARAGLVTFHPVPNHTEALPNKLFEYMAAGIPVIASDFPLWREIIETAGCGLLVNPLDPQAISEAILRVLEHPQEADEMGRRGSEAVKTLYNWDLEAERLLQLYTTALQQPVGVR